MSARLGLGLSALFVGARFFALDRLIDRRAASWVAALMHVRLAYVMLLPGFATGALGVSDAKRTSVLFIILAVLAYLIRVQAVFAFPTKASAALVAALGTPLQVGMAALYNGDSVWVFFMEDFFRGVSI